MVLPEDLGPLAGAATDALRGPATRLAGDILSVYVHAARMGFEQGLTSVFQVRCRKPEG